MWRVALALTLVLSGCAGSVSVSPVANHWGSVGGTKPGGVHYYAPAPYVWITRATKSGTSPRTSKDSSDQKAQYTIEVLFLPDPSHEYAIEWKSGWFGAVDPKFTLENGWNLVAFESTINTAFSGWAGVTGFVQRTVTSKAGIAEVESEPSGLYKLEYDKEKGSWTLGAKVFPGE